MLALSSYQKSQWLCRQIYVVQSSRPHTAECQFYEMQDLILGAVPYPYGSISNCVLQKSSAHRPLSCCHVSSVWSYVGCAGQTHPIKHTSAQHTVFFHQPLQSVSCPVDTIPASRVSMLLDSRAAQHV